MAAELIDGNKMAETIKESPRKEVLELKAGGINPSLAVIFNGADPLSRKYALLKEKACEDVGIDIFTYSINTSHRKLVELIGNLNADPKVNGILVQFPLPDGLDEKDLMNEIAPEKDIDSCGYYNLGRLISGGSNFIPCATYGVMKMLDVYEIGIAGKHAVVVGSSSTAKYLALLLLKKNATVTVCSCEAPNLKKKCLRADILCVSAGKAKTVTGDMVKEGAAVIDMGMNVTPNGKVVGDVDFNTAKERAAYITPYQVVRAL